MDFINHINTLIVSVQIGQSKGAYTLEQASQIFIAIKSIKKELEQKKKPLPSIPEADFLEL